MMTTKGLACVLVLLTASTGFSAIDFGPAPAMGIIVHTNATGGLVVRSTAGPMTTLEVTSTAGLFTMEPQPSLDGLFDVNSQFKKFKLDPEGFDGLVLPAAVDSGISLSDLAADLTLDGSFLAGGALSTVPNVMLAVPEPSGLSLIALGLLGVLMFRRTH